MTFQAATAMLYLAIIASMIAVEANQGWSR